MTPSTDATAFTHSATTSGRLPSLILGTHSTNLSVILSQVSVYGDSGLRREWANIIINGIKSSPLFLMLGFALTQYQKERNLLEEYAFRESVAVTLTAYLEQMPEKEDEDKRKMLISTVEQLYTKPVIANKEYDLIKFDTKDLSESTKTLKEIIDTLTGKK